MENPMAISNAAMLNGSKSTPHRESRPKMPQLILKTEKTAVMMLRVWGIKNQQINAVQTIATATLPYKVLSIDIV